MSTLQHSLYKGFLASEPVAGGRVGGRLIESELVGRVQLPACGSYSAPRHRLSPHVVLHCLGGVSNIFQCPSTTNAPVKNHC
jgi:hypothetical protein